MLPKEVDKERVSFHICKRVYINQSISSSSTPVPCFQTQENLAPLGRMVGNY